ncbi:MAG: SPOR domain-containing protein [Thiolinea sp.]
MRKNTIAVCQRLFIGALLSLFASSGFTAEKQCTAHFIQLFATSVPAKANTMQITLQQAGFKALIKSFKDNEKTIYRVRTGPYRNKNEAVTAQQKMQSTLQENASAQNSIIITSTMACDTVFPANQAQNTTSQSNADKTAVNETPGNTQSTATPLNRTSARFNAYKAPARHTGKHHPLVVDEFSQMFKTRLQDALKNNKPGFAGHYVVSGWGCGTGCYTGAVIDVKTGIATPFPVSMTSVFPLKPEFKQEDGQAHIYRLDSRLMVFAGHLGNPARGDGTDSVELYEFKNGNFIFIESRPYGRSPKN